MKKLRSSSSKNKMKNMSDFEFNVNKNEAFNC